MTTVAEIIKSKSDGKVHSVKPTDTVLSALKLMADMHIGALLVMEGDKIAAIDIVQQQETAGVGSLALEALPARIIEAQSTEVDAVAGATVSSTALKDAMNNALAQVK